MGTNHPIMIIRIALKASFILLNRVASFFSIYIHVSNKIKTEHRKMLAAKKGIATPFLVSRSMYRLSLLLFPSSAKIGLIG